MDTAYRGGAFSGSSSFPAGSDQEIWRYRQFGTFSNSGNAADPADPDHDGRTNLEEYHALTDPNDAFSVFTAAVAVNGPLIVITFQSASGRHYTLQHSPDLSSWSNTGTPIFGDGTMLSFTIPGDALRQYCRVLVSP